MNLTDSVPEASDTAHLVSALQHGRISGVSKRPAILGQSTSKIGVTPPRLCGGPTGSRNRSKFLCYKL